MSYVRLREQVAALVIALVLALGGLVLSALALYRADRALRALSEAKSAPLSGPGAGSSSATVAPPPAGTTYDFGVSAATPAGKAAAVGGVAVVTAAAATPSAKSLSPASTMAQKIQRVLPSSGNKYEVRAASGASVVWWRPSRPTECGE